MILQKQILSGELGINPNDPTQWIRGQRTNHEIMVQTFDSFKSTIQKLLDQALEEVKYNQEETKRNPDNTEAKNQLSFWTARVAVYQKMLGLTQADINKISSGIGMNAYIMQETAKYTSSLDKLNGTDSNKYNQDIANNTDPNSILNTSSGIMDFFSGNIAGFPVWAWLLIGGAGIYLLYDNKKKKKPRTSTLHPGQKYLTA